MFLARRSLYSKMESIIDHCRRLHSNETLLKKKPYTIVVEGNIGAGKTTFLQNIKDFSPPDLIHVTDEPVLEWKTYKGKYDLLDMMYEDPKKWSFLFQVQVQLSMMKKYKAPVEAPIRLMERSLARFCFVENLHNNGLLNDVELHMLNDLYNFTIEHECFVCSTDLIVYLRTSPEVAYERMLSRSRSEAEKSLSLEHFRNIHDLHEDWLVRKTKFQPLPCPVVVIDGDKGAEELRAEFPGHQEILLKNVPKHLNYL
uniref:Deoxynucleoside kinase n=1 Tax=Caligus rogercresseyi TaxID=217165 RepID=C1BRI4_CALRO|nr:Deoxynucleoside kinase [Caligus rogercresseyi]